MSFSTYYELEEDSIGFSRDEVMITNGVYVMEKYN
jgi:hypothetical protein